MGYKIRLLPVARQDLQAAKKWYNDQKAHLGEEFKLQVNQEIDYIGEFPEHYQRKYKELRQSLVERFPYAIFYLVEEEKKQVVIFGVLHTSRDPETIRKRRK
mgnify:CR=1 FL=1|jgi:plasmid stabilization system protein ParE